MSELSYPEKRKLLADLLEKKNRTRKTAPLSFAQERLFFLDQLRERISKLNILSQQERRQLVTEWKETTVPSGPLVHEAIAAQAQRTPEAVAIKFGESLLTYGELDARAFHVARGLRSAGISKETIVGICMKRSSEAVVALLGILKAGAAYLPLDPDSPDELLERCLRNAGATVVLTPAAFESRVRSWSARPVYIESLAIDAAELDGAEVTINPEHIAYVTIASGPTGGPLAIAVSQQSLAAHCQNLIRCCELGPSDHVLHLASFVDAGSGLTQVQHRKITWRSCAFLWLK
jgi:non-ribosomal peptide synthetase component F